MPALAPCRFVFFIFGLCILCVAGASGTAVAQPANSPVSAPVIPPSVGTAYDDFQSSYWRDFAIPYYQQQLLKEKLNVAALQSQRSTGYFILVFVVLIVLAGLALSILQFLKGVWLAKAQPLPDDPSKFTANLQGVEVQSSSIGLLILTVSLVFFYLYIKYVYTITILR
jgi:hypothetical protein